PTIDPHDFGVKLDHAIEFLCEEMKVKISLRFRGREMAHKEFGFQTIDKFIKAVAPYGHPDSAPKLIGKGITVMLSPLPRNKRAKNPRQSPESEHPVSRIEPQEAHQEERVAIRNGPPSPRRSEDQSGNFANNPFAELDLK